jgi:hypothetical protein
VWIRPREICHGNAFWGGTARWFLRLLRGIGLTDSHPDYDRRSGDDRHSDYGERAASYPSREVRPSSWPTSSA